MSSVMFMASLLTRIEFGANIAPLSMRVEDFGGQAIR
jgi:hypothetical protein